MTPTKIVVTDGWTAAREANAWDPLRAWGEVDVYERCGPRLALRCRDARVVITNKEPLDAAVLAQLPELQLVSVLATGTNVVDVEAASARGVVVCNVPNYSAPSVAQHVFALLLELVNHTSEHHHSARDGRWSRSGHFSFSTGSVNELEGKTLGIVGLGHIGRRVASIAQAFGMLVWGAERQSGVISHPSPDPAGVRRAPLDELFRRCDVVSLHCPLTANTTQLVNRARLSSMKPTALLINTGRGGLVDEAALLEALDAGWIAGAGLDVLCQEPPAPDHPLLNHPRVVVTPHVAWASVEARARLLEITFSNVRAFLTGTPQNVVTPSAARPTTAPTES